MLKRRSSDIACADDSNLHQQRSASKILSIVENRAREICISKICIDNGSLLEIYILVDSHTYGETLETLFDIQPDEILLHDSSKQSPLAKKIEDNMIDSKIVYINRQYFDQDRGADLLKKVIVGEVDADLIAKYTVLAGCYCLLRYIENCEGITFAEHSLRVEFTANFNVRVGIDRRTCINLELIANMKTGNQKTSLFGCINFTKTVVGGRLLRSSILRPCTDIQTIETRLDIVQLLLRNAKLSTDMKAIFSQLPDLDKMLTGLTVTPKKITLKSARVGIDTLIFLKDTLNLVPALASIIVPLRKHRELPNSPMSTTNTSEGLIDLMIQNFEDESLASIQADITSMLTPSTKASKSQHEMRHQECFAVRAGMHGLLDVARMTFLQSVEDIYKVDMQNIDDLMSNHTAEAYSTELEAPVKVTFSGARGYYLSIPSEVHPLPHIFTQAVLNKRSISCSTEDISALSDRASQAIGEALSLTHELIFGLLVRIRARMDSLFALTDSVALLDMLASFAAMVEDSPHSFSRPIVTSSGPLVIQAGRHPILSAKNPQRQQSSFVANDTLTLPTTNFEVITGPNGSGKTVYIKQVALIVIMAQIGCYVPARHATIPIRDRILSRLGTSDDMEHNLSSFLTEMKESTYILKNNTDRALIIVDELGRGTSNVDGLSLAFSIAEALLESKAYTLFVSHFPQITSLADMYPNVKNLHLKASIEAVQVPVSQEQSDLGDASTRTVVLTSSKSSIRFTHEVGNGPCEIRCGYGILVSELCGFPPAMVAESRAIQRVVRNLFPLLFQIEGVDLSIGAISSTLQNLLLLQNSSLDDQSLRNYLRSLRKRIDGESMQNMLRYVHSLASTQGNTSNTPLRTQTTAGPMFNGHPVTQSFQQPATQTTVALSTSARPLATLQHPHANPLVPSSHKSAVDASQSLLRSVLTPRESHRLPLLSQPGIEPLTRPAAIHANPHLRSTNEMITTGANVTTAARPADVAAVARIDCQEAASAQDLGERIEEVDFAEEFSPTSSVQKNAQTLLKSTSTIEGAKDRAVARKCYISDNRLLGTRSFIAAENDEPLMCNLDGSLTLLPVHSESGNEGQQPSREDRIDRAAGENGTAIDETREFPKLIKLLDDDRVGTTVRITQNALHSDRTSGFNSQPHFTVLPQWNGGDVHTVEHNSPRREILVDTEKIAETLEAPNAKGDKMLLYRDCTNQSNQKEFDHSVTVAPVLPKPATARTVPSFPNGDSPNAGMDAVSRHFSQEKSGDSAAAAAPLVSHLISGVRSGPFKPPAQVALPIAGTGVTVSKPTKKKQKVTRSID